MKEKGLEISMSEKIKECECKVVRKNMGMRVVRFIGEDDAQYMHEEPWFRNIVDHSSCPLHSDEALAEKDRKIDELERQKLELALEVAKLRTGPTVKRLLDSEKIPNGLMETRLDGPKGNL